MNFSTNHQCARLHKIIPATKWIGYVQCVCVGGGGGGGGGGGWVGVTIIFDIYIHRT